MDTQKLRKNIKRLRRAKIKFKERIQKFYKKKIQEIDDEIYSTQLLIKSKEKNDKVIFSSKMTSQLKPYSPSPMKAKTRKKERLDSIHNFELSKRIDARRKRAKRGTFRIPKLRKTGRDLTKGGRKKTRRKKKRKHKKSFQGRECKIR